jgi:hypothetical protein
MKAAQMVQREEQQFVSIGCFCFPALQIAGAIPILQAL